MIHHYFDLHLLFFCRFCVLPDFLNRCFRCACLYRFLCFCLLYFSFFLRCCFFFFYGSLLGLLRCIFFCTGHRDRQRFPIQLVYIYDHCLVPRSKTITGYNRVVIHGKSVHRISRADLKECAVSFLDLARQAVSLMIRFSYHLNSVCAGCVSRFSCVFDNNVIIYFYTIGYACDFRTDVTGEHICMSRVDTQHNHIVGNI